MISTGRMLLIANAAYAVTQAKMNASQERYQEQTESALEPVGYVAGETRQVRRARERREAKNGRIVSA